MIKKMSDIQLKTNNTHDANLFGTEHKESVFKTSKRKKRKSQSIEVL